MGREVWEVCLETALRLARQGRASDCKAVLDRAQTLRSPKHDLAVMYIQCAMELRWFGEIYFEIPVDHECVWPDVLLYKRVLFQPLYEATFQSIEEQMATGAVGMRCILECLIHCGKNADMNAILLHPDVFSRLSDLFEKFFERWPNYVAGENDAWLPYTAALCKLMAGRNQAESIKVLSLLTRGDSCLPQSLRTLAREKLLLCNTTTTMDENVRRDILELFDSLCLLKDCTYAFMNFYAKVVPMAARDGQGDFARLLIERFWKKATKFHSSAYALHNDWKNITYGTDKHAQCQLRYGMLSVATLECFVLDKLKKNTCKDDNDTTTWDIQSRADLISCMYARSGSTAILVMSLLYLDASNKKQQREIAEMATEWRPKSAFEFAAAAYINLLNGNTSLALRHIDRSREDNDARVMFACLSDTTALVEMWVKRERRLGKAHVLLEAIRRHVEWCVESGQFRKAFTYGYAYLKMGKEKRKPAIRALLLSISKKQCARCERKAKKRWLLLGKCSGCQSTYYCNAWCQELHWPMHKLICGNK